MTKSSSLKRAGRTLVAVVTSIVTGATAGAALARKPLVVRCDEQPRIRRAA
ncbi:MAG: hypothetical protein ACR2HM_07440 [Acidimicrobiales bacterium]